MKFTLCETNRVVTYDLVEEKLKILQQFSRILILVQKYKKEVIVNGFTTIIECLHDIVIVVVLIILHSLNCYFC
jgi:hypothetical protein